MNSKPTGTAIVNHIVRKFEMTAQEVGPHLKADLIKRGWDGTSWIGISPAEGRKHECTALFYRTPSGVFVPALAL